MRSISEIKHVNGECAVTIRDWEGIGTPDFYNIRLNSSEVDKCLSDFKAVADAIKVYERELVVSRKKEIKSQLEALNRELIKLEEKELQS
jgi:hypothetical protein